MMAPSCQPPLRLRQRRKAPRHGTLSLVLIFFSSQMVCALDGTLEAGMQSDPSFAVNSHGRSLAAQGNGVASVVTWATQLTDSECTWTQPPSPPLLQPGKKNKRNAPDTPVPAPLHVHAPGLGLDTPDADIINGRLQNSSKPLLLCMLKHSVEALASESPDSGLQGQVAMFSIADTPAYLVRDDPISRHTTMSIWSAHLSKVTYSKAKNIPFFLMFGGLTERNQFRNVSTAVNCKSRGPGSGLVYVGFLKSLGLLALFELKPQLAGAVYIDCDASIVDFQLMPEEILALAPSADLMGVSNFKEPIVMNAGVLVFRNKKWTKRMLTTWWSYRCGYNDQISLWQSMFAMWGLSINPGSWASTSTSNAPTTDSLRYLAEVYPTLQRSGLLSRTRWRCDGACGWLFKWSGCLSEPLELPHVLLLPPKPFVDETGKQTVALQHYSGVMYHHEHKDQWVCHADNMAARGCSPKNPWSNEREFCEWCWAGVKQVHGGCHQRRKRCSISEHETVCELQNSSVYLCSCAEVLLPRYSMLPGGAHLSAQCESCANASWVLDANDATASVLQKPSYITENSKITKGLKMHANRSAAWLAKQRNKSIAWEQHIRAMKARRRVTLDQRARLREQLLANISKHGGNLSNLSSSKLFKKKKKHSSKDESQMTEEQIEARKKKKKKIRRKKERLKAAIAAGLCKDAQHCHNATKALEKKRSKSTG